MNNVTAFDVDTIAGYNGNYEDTVTLENMNFLAVRHFCRVFKIINEKPTSVSERCFSRSPIHKCVCDWTI